MAHYIPSGFTAVTPYLVVTDVEGELAFMQQVFGATELYRIPGPGGAPMHVELQIGGARIMVGRARNAADVVTGMVCVYLPDVDAAFARATAIAGATVAMPLADQFYGDRSGAVRSANGVYWHLATHVEDLTPQQIHDRMAAMKHP